MNGTIQATIGQAHLLDTIIDNLEQELEMPPHPSGKSYYARRTLAYGLGERVRKRGGRVHCVLAPAVTDITIGCLLQHDLFPLLWQGE